MYSVIFRNDHRPSDFVVIASGLTSLVQARKAREASGDLVIHTHSGQIVQNPYWLWDYERRNPDSYAHRELRKNIPSIPEESVHMKAKKDTRIMLDLMRKFEGKLTKDTLWKLTFTFPHIWQADRFRAAIEGMGLRATSNDWVVTVTKP